MAKRRGNKKQVSAYLSPSLKASLDNLAAGEGRSLSNYVEKLLIEHLGKTLSAEQLEALKADSALLASLLEDQDSD